MRRFAITVLASSVALASMVLSITPASSTPPGPPSPLAFSASSIDGGGWENVVAISPIVPPGGEPVVLAGGDVSGVHRSTDWGMTWAPSNSGLEVQQFVDLAVASLAFSPSGRAFAAIGTTSPTSGGLYVSDDQGATWTLGPRRPDGSACPYRDNGATTPHFYGSARIVGNDTRSTGNLLAFGTTQKTAVPVVYAGTYSQGLMRSDDGGCTWQTVTLVTGAPQQPVVMSIDVYKVAPAHAGDPVEERVFVGTESYGVIEVDNANADTIDGVKKPLPMGAPFTNAKALDIVGDAIFVAGATSGVFRYPLPLGPWQPIYPDPTNPSLPNNVNWVSVTGYIDPSGVTRLYAGARNNTLSLQLWDSTTQQWHGVFDSARANVFSGLGGPTAAAPRRSWWSCRSTQADDPCTNDFGWGPGGAWFSANHIALDLPAGASAPQHVFVSSAIGIWGTASAWGPFSSQYPTRWYPLVRGLNSTVANSAVDGSPCSLASVSDFMLFSSNDGFRANVSIVSPWSDWGTRGTTATVNGTRVYSGTGDNSGSSDNNSDPKGGTTSGNVQTATFDQQTCRPNSVWTQAAAPLDFNIATKNNQGKRPIASALGGTRLLETTKCVGASANSKCGAVWVFDSAAPAAWTDISPQTSAGIGTTSAILVPLALSWPVGARFAYLYDTKSGLWRWDSEAKIPNAGWSLIWSHVTSPSTYLTNNQGSIAASHDATTNIDTVFVSVATSGQDKFGNVYKVSNAGGASPSTAPIPGAPTAPGPLALHPNGSLLYVTTYQTCTAIGRPDTCSQPGLVSYAPDTGLWSTDAGGPPGLSASDTTYKAVGFLPTSVSVGASGRVYVTLATDGLLVSG
jgi:hypothetical protein